MTPTGLQKKENMPPRSHLQLVRVERTPEQHLELEFKEAVVALTVPEGTERPRRLYKIAADELTPLRILARVLSDALKADIDPWAVWRVVSGPVRRFIERKAQRRLPRRKDNKFLPAG